MRRAPAASASNKRLEATMPNKLTTLPQSLIDLAKTSRDLVIEDDSVLYSVNHGYGPFATVCVNHWLAVRDGALVMETNISSRPNCQEAGQEAGWVGSDQFSVSGPLSEAQALQVVDFWKHTAIQAERLTQQADRFERQRLDAFGPRPARPWEAPAEPVQTEQASRPSQMG